MTSDFTPPTQEQTSSPWWPFVLLLVLAFAGVVYLVLQPEPKAQSQARSTAPTYTNPYQVQIATLEAGIAVRDATRTAPPPSTNQLELISSSCTPSAIGVVTCEGFVNNISGRTLSFVQVRVVWYDGAGKPVASHDSYLDLTTLPAGQRSSWNTADVLKSGLTKYSIEFEENGKPLPYRDAR